MTRPAILISAPPPRRRDGLLLTVCLLFLAFRFPPSALQAATFITPASGGSGGAITGAYVFPSSQFSTVNVTNIAVKSGALLTNVTHYGTLTTEGITAGDSITSVLDITALGTLGGAILSISGTAYAQDYAATGGIYSVLGFIATNRVGHQVVTNFIALLPGTASATNYFLRVTNTTTGGAEWAALPASAAAGNYIGSSNGLGTNITLRGGTTIRDVLPEAGMTYGIGSDIYPLYDFVTYTLSIYDPTNQTTINFLGPTNSTSGATFRMTPTNGISGQVLTVTGNQLHWKDDANSGGGGTAVIVTNMQPGGIVTAEIVAVATNICFTNLAVVTTNIVFTNMPAGLWVETLVYANPGVTITYPQSTPANTIGGQAISIESNAWSRVRAIRLGSVTNFSIDTVEAILVAGSFASLTTNVSVFPPTVTVASAQTGETNTMSNSGLTNSTRVSLFTNKTGVDFPMRTISAGANVSITNEGTNIVIAGTASGGSTNMVTASFGSQDTTNSAVFRGALTATNLGLNLFEISATGGVTLVTSNAAPMRVVMNGKEVFIITNDPPVATTWGEMTFRPTLDGSGTQNGLYVRAATSGTTGARYGAKVVLEAGSSGSTQPLIAFEADNESTGTGRNLGQYYANYGIAADTLGSSSGLNLAVNGYALNGGLNIGFLADIGRTPKTGGWDVGYQAYVENNTSGGRNYGYVATAAKPLSAAYDTYLDDLPQSMFIADVDDNGDDTFYFVGMTNVTTPGTNFVLNAEGKFTRMNNERLFGVGTAYILSDTNKTGIIDTNVPSSTLFPTVQAGTYRVSVYHVCTSAASAGTLDTTIGWTDPVTSRTKTPAPQINLNATNFDLGTALIRCTAASTITFSTTVGGLSGSATYSVYITVERVQ